MTVEQLRQMPKDMANRLLNLEQKRKWVFVHNDTANCYFVKNGKIEDVPPEGWWY